ncbi:MoaD/ThiS family protein [Aquitalea sp. S1-19]|uniref:MoaD/ThiS family protein n=1 Tax=Craterilacuibacter sinensis TaxID=2686017 RepID=A0A845BP43_9NEIS|nr:MoaD/ThiS family protein [Craterilacuibacter sinensis]MCP9760962.1 MoaD/ThiS family protein [Aquitalea sp. S1-19]MXR37024.1 MoaD/ThiS family protein [Craterilacuibacter sinensis]
MIRILYFGFLREALGRDEESLDWAGGTSEDLLSLLRARGDDWAAALAPDKVFRVVVDREIKRGVAEIADGAEVGILPPVTGG